MIGATLKEARLKAGLTQADLAEMAGLTREYISQLELDRRMATIPVFVRLCRLLGLSGARMGEMLESVDDKTPVKSGSSKRRLKR